VSLHSRQYLVGPQPRLVRPDWQTRHLDDGLILSHCPTLPVADTAHGLILGDPLPTVEADAGPETWSGRWIRIQAGVLRLDSGGLLACFMRQTPAGRWASSSLEVLRTLDPEQPPHADRLERNWRLMDWYPPPHSAIEGVTRLLASQTLVLATGERGRSSLPQPQPDDRDRSTGRVRSRLVNAIAAASDLAAADGGRVWIGLTGGRDSRLLLAAAVDAGIDVMTHTFIRPQTTQGDRDLPPKLAAAAGYEHVFISLEGVDAQRAADFDTHTSGGFSGGPQLQYSSGALEQVEASSVMLEGGCFEMARGYYYDRLPRDVGGDPGSAADVVLEKFPSQRPAGVRAWADWAFADPDDGLDWRDRFYLEQRVGGWLSAGLQGFDISGRRSLHIGNDRGILADLLGFPQAERRASSHQAALVELMAPALAAFPYNPGSGSGKGKGGTKAASDGSKASGTGGPRRRGLLSRLSRGRGS